MIATGSTLEVFRYDESCFQLRTMMNQWLRVDYDRNEILADGFLKLQGDFFSAVPVPPSHTSTGSPSSMLLKVCKRNVWIQVQMEYNADLFATESGSELLQGDASRPYRLGILPFSTAQKQILGGVNPDLTSMVAIHTSTLLRRWMGALPGSEHSSAASLGHLLQWTSHLDASFGRWSTRTARAIEGSSLAAGFLRGAGRVDGGAGPRSSRRMSAVQEDGGSSASAPHLPPSAVFDVRRQSAIHGVNLGGWFIPEVWMLPSFFAGSGLGWSGSLCR
jgi:hypothetical protein